MMKHFTNSLKSEMIKTKKSVALLLTLYGPLFVIGIFFIAYYFKGGLMLPKNQDPWIPFVSKIWNGLTMVFLPMYILLISNLLLSIEHKNYTWRLVYTLPQSKSYIFWSKFTVLYGFVFSAIASTMALTVIAGLILSVVKPEYNFHLNAIPVSLCFKLIISVFTYSIGLIAIYFFISNEIKNQVKAISIGLLFFISTVIAGAWEYSFLIPTSIPMTYTSIYFNSLADKQIQIDSKYLVVVAAYFAIFIAASWIRTIYRRVI
jgi:hypothetical protein